ncbi:TonB-dependent receptor [Novosphingobium sp. EMRT-2]|uniref:TonB-dependent receptor n=1 Tax=Novosphingobium sp. EMRT-2 TaxID=2571749 RepID=UPI0010BD9C1C|nr:TonB-dependent receptor [Novosphingobium sp. EMRT-2]QCI92840.1 TonB-dependent receptor [Novosphingobium sp. EMRT-2]
MKAVFLAGVAGMVVSSVVAAPAMAQESTADNQSTGLQEIVVTAQRRAENLQNVPIAITAASGEALATARVENISNIQAVSPSITFRATNISSSTANVIIRGLGTTGNSRSFEGSVGVFIDGVYRTRAAAALQSFLDIDNLQVLRGPQGTLFGKNTTAGALLLSSAKPSTDRMEGLFDASYGNYNTFTVRAAGNVPISDHAAFRIAGVVSHRDGFYTNPTNGEHLNGDSTQAIKAQLLFEPTPDLTIRLIGDYSHGGGNCCYATSDFKNGPTQPLVDLLTTLNGGKVPSRKLSDYQQTLNGNGRQTITDYGGTLQIEAGLGGGTLKSVTAIRKFKLDQRDMDPDFSGADIFRYYENFDSRFISQELTYNTKISALNADAVFGGFISDEKLKMGRTLPWASQGQAYWNAVLGASGIPAGTVNASVGPWAVEAMSGKARSYAGFAHLDFALGSKFNIIAGVRYSVEKKQGAFRNSFFSPFPNTVFTVLGLGPSPNYDKTKTDKAVSGTLGIQYRPVDDVMLYATYNRGFKAGGVNIDANAAGTLFNNPTVFNALPPQLQGLIRLISPTSTVSTPLDPTYKPEKVNAYEVGAKFQYLNRRARTNIALFYYDLSDLQIAQFVGLRFTVLNAKSAKDYGVEIENLFQLSDSLTLGIDGTWIPHAKYAKDASIDPVLSDSRFRFAPKLSANVALNLDQPLSDNLNLTGRVQYQYTSRQLISTASLSEQGPVSLVNANLGFKIPKWNLLVEGWVQNLFNRTYFTQSFPTPLQTGDENGYLGAPRTYGLRLRATF